MKIYVASSWRNNIQQEVVQKLRESGHEVYDFKNPEPGNNGFHWSSIDPEWKNWSPEQFRTALHHPIADSGFGLDMKALKWCEACVLVLPCGRSAHLEAGYAIGAGKPTIILLQEAEPELMYKMTPYICVNIEEVVRNLEGIQVSEDGENQIISKFKELIDRFFDVVCEYLEDLIEENDRKNDEGVENE